MTYRGRLRLKGVPFFRFQVYERVVISLVKVYAEKGREISHFSRHKGGSKGLTDTFYGFDEEKKTFWFCEVCERGTICQQKVYERGPFLSKMVCEKPRGWTSGRSLPV